MTGTTWTEQQAKAQRLVKSNNADVLTQLKQDMNTGYHMFNARLGRYYSRKQQFASLVANQSIYQTPVDSVKVLTVSVAVNTNYEPTVKEVRSEYEWRNMKSYKTFATNWPSHYFVLGNDSIQFYPTPSQAYTNGIRYIYQPQDHDLTVEDVTSTSTGATVTVTNGSTTVTASSGVLNTDMATLSFQITGRTDNTWYEIVSATTTTLTLKTPYVGTSGSALAWRVGQLSILPGEYADAPMHYALGNFFSAQGNEGRAQYHLGTKDKPGVFYDMMSDCEEQYSSSNESSVITGDDNYYNVWLATPNAAP